MQPTLETPVSPAEGVHYLFFGDRLLHRALRDDGTGHIVEEMLVVWTPDDGDNRTFLKFLWVRDRLTRVTLNGCLNPIAHAGLWHRPAEIEAVKNRHGVSDGLLADLVPDRVRGAVQGAYRRYWAAPTPVVDVPPPDGRRLVFDKNVSMDGLKSDGDDGDEPIVIE